MFVTLEPLQVEMIRVKGIHSFPGDEWKITRTFLIHYIVYVSREKFIVLLYMDINYIT